MKPRTEISMQLYNLMMERGYPENLCDLVTRNLNTDYTATRMIGYLSHYSDLPDVEVVDEMLAILSDRNELIKKKESEQAQARISEIYRFGYKPIKRRILHLHLCKLHQNSQYTRDLRYQRLYVMCNLKV